MLRYECSFSLSKHTFLRAETLLLNAPGLLSPLSQWAAYHSLSIPHLSFAPRCSTQHPNYLGFSSLHHPSSQKFPSLCLIFSWRTCVIYCVLSPLEYTWEGAEEKGKDLTWICFLKEQSSSVFSQRIRRISTNDEIKMMMWTASFRKPWYTESCQRVKTRMIPSRGKKVGWIPLKISPGC